MAAHDATITMPWADGTHAFRLPINQLLELQEKCNAGPVEIFDRLQLRTWRVQDVREVIRLGLIGGGKDTYASLALVSRYVDDRPLLESVPVAAQILAAALMGPAEEEGTSTGKPMAGEEAPGSPPPPSSVPAPSSDSPRETSAT
ncbi:gene transfer agent family protein [Xanthobacteraceae bacterium A53D]